MRQKGPRRTIFKRMPKGSNFAGERVGPNRHGKTLQTGGQADQQFGAIRQKNGIDDHRRLRHEIECGVLRTGLRDTII